MHNPHLLLHQLKLFFKRLIQNKSHAIYNLFGLIIGIIPCMLIFYYNAYELSYDSFHEKKSSIYRVRNNVISSETGEIRTTRATSQGSWSTRGLGPAQLVAVVGPFEEGGREGRLVIEGA